MSDHQPPERVVDVWAVLAAMQQQIDDLAAAVEAQQRTLDELVARSRQSENASRPRDTR